MCRLCEPLPFQKRVPDNIKFCSPDNQVLQRIMKKLLNVAIKETQTIPSLDFPKTTLQTRVGHPNVCLPRLPLHWPATVKIPRLIMSFFLSIPSSAPVDFV